MTRVQFWGQTAHRDFREAADWLGKQPDVAITFECDVEGALAVCRCAPEPPAVVIACQARPGAVSQFDIQRLQAAAPLARMVLLLGGWCEGEPREARQLQGVARIQWTRWRQALPAALELSAASPGSIWRLPLSASQPEQFLNAAQATLASGAGAVSIWTDRFDKYQALAEVCAAGGFGAVWLRCTSAVQGAAAAIWDGDFDSPCQVAALRELAAATSPRPTLALAGFVRADDVQLAQQAGAAAAIAKPYIVHELLASLAAGLVTGGGQVRAA